MVIAFCVWFFEYVLFKKALEHRNLFVPKMQILKLPCSRTLPTASYEFLNKNRHNLEITNDNNTYHNSLPYLNLLAQLPCGDISWWDIWDLALVTNKAINFLALLIYLVCLSSVKLLDHCSHPMNWDYMPLWCPNLCNYLCIGQIFDSSSTQRYMLVQPLILLSYWG